MPPAALLHPTESSQGAGMSLTHFCASPSGRFIRNSAGETVIEFVGFTEAETAKHILIAGARLRTLLAEREASLAGHGPIPDVAFDAPIRAALSHLIDRVRSDPAALAARSWELHGHVIREFPTGKPIATLLVTPPRGFEALMAAPQLCAAAMRIIAGEPVEGGIEVLPAA